MAIWVKLIVKKILLISISRTKAKLAYILKSVKEDRKECIKFKERNEIDVKFCMN